MPFQPDLPLWPRPLQTPPPRLDSDPKVDLRSESGRNQVKIGSESGAGGGRGSEGFGPEG